MLILTSSCAQYKDITYLRNLHNNPTDTIFKGAISDYKIQPADILYIKINSLDENISKMFNQDLLANSSVISTQSGIFVAGYTVDNEGNISLPLIGKVNVGGKNINESQKTVQEIVVKFISDARIDLRLMSFKISILGEVKKPGQYSIFNDKANIFEAIALAGDLTYYANRKQILILRTEKNNEIHTIRVDMTDKAILSSDYFLLQPNDIVYVEPLKSAAIRLSASDYSILLSAFTATLTSIILILNFNK